MHVNTLFEVIVSMGVQLNIKAIQHQGNTWVLSCVRAYVQVYSFANIGARTCECVCLQAYVNARARACVV